MSLDVMKQALAVLEDYEPNEAHKVAVALRAAIEHAERPQKQDDREWAAIPGTNVRVPIRHVKEQNK